jgi:hypothetical protein
MASNINPNNIDTTYPIAGQDNDSQGFRDNFTNIKSNFTEAQGEIDDLQSKVILKSALSGTTLDNDFDGAIVSSAKLQDIRETVVALGTANGTLTLNHNAGHYYTVTLNGTSTVAFSNLPPSGSKGRIQLQVTISSTAHTLTLPAAVTKGVVGIQGISSNVITFGSTGTYIFEFTTADGGTSLHVEELTRPRNSFQNPVYMASSEDVADAAAMDLTKAVSYFTTGGAETATLAAGVEGQVKYLAMVGDSGDMVVTVTNAGWKASGTGTITFDDIGDSATLLYTNSKWYAVGTNGVAYA